MPWVLDIGYLKIILKNLSYEQFGYLILDDRRLYPFIVNKALGSTFFSPVKALAFVIYYK